MELAAVPIGIWQIAPALRMGNAVVHEPSEHTPLCSLALIEVPGQVLPRDVLIALPKKVVAASAGNLSRLTLELGGNDAAVVLPDADPAAIAERLFWGAFLKNGQTCGTVKRLYVPDGIYDQVATKVGHRRLKGHAY